MSSQQEQAVARVIRAVAERGPGGGVHQRQIERLIREWPPLARALAGLMTAYGTPAPKEWTS